MLGNCASFFFSSAVFFSTLTFLKYSLIGNTIRVSNNLGLDKTPHLPFVKPGLDPNCMQRAVSRGKREPLGKNLIFCSQLKHCEVQENRSESFFFNLYILNYKRNPSVTSQGNYGNRNLEMKIYLYHIPLLSVLHDFIE